MSVAGNTRVDVVLCGILTILGALLWVGADSFWIDEGNAAFKAVQGTFSGWYDTLVTSGGSDAQMPGFMIYGWGWEKLFGRSEFALRASNLPWYALALWSLREWRSEMLVLALSPFVLYYLNEFRPYMMQIAGAAVVVSGLRRLGSEVAAGWRRILAGCVILCAASLIGVIWSAGALVAALILRPDILTNKWVWRDTLIIAPVFAVLGCYYLRSLMMGQGAAELGGSLVMSAGACLYELMGLLGLGPGKVELRVNPASVREHVLPLAAGAICATLCWSAGLKGFRETYTRRGALALLAGIGIPVGVLVALIFLRDFRLLARHLAPLAVLLAYLTAKALEGCGFDGWWKRVVKGCAVMSILIGLTSALSARFCERHRKDGYRQAAQLAHAAGDQGRRVVWDADAPTGMYYGLRFAPAGSSGRCVLWDPTVSTELAGDELVILSKPDLYDSQGVLRAALKSGGFVVVEEHIPAFTVWSVSKNGHPGQ